MPQQSTENVLPVNTNNPIQVPEATSSSNLPEPMDQENSTGTSRRRNIQLLNKIEDEDDSGSEFESNDQIDHFDLWSSDATSPDSSEDEYYVSKRAKTKWMSAIKKKLLHSFSYVGPEGITKLDPQKKYSALDCFKLFVTDEMINLMVTETNKNARSKFIRYGYHEGFLSGWLDVNFKEMTQFIGMIIFMAFKRLPELSLYWSTERLYFNSVACRVFTQTRFYRILAFWSFGSDGTDSVHAKVNPIINMLNSNFRKYKIPGKILYVGRSTVYLRNKYIFEAQPIECPKKGSKILKVMDQDVYTYKLKILSPGSSSRKETSNNVINLLSGFLNEGRSVIFHNLWISIDLAEDLLSYKCHSIGMIRKNSRGTPKELDDKPLVDTEMTGLQNSNGVSVMKWQLLGIPYYGISTYHTLELVTVQKRVQKDTIMDNNSSSTSTTSSTSTLNNVEEKTPKYLRDISLSERIFDANDKFSINTSALNEHVKWHQRIACDAFVNAATINALVLYKKLNKEKIKMWDFRDKLFRELVDIKQLPNISSDEETEEPDLDD